MSEERKKKKKKERKKNNLPVLRVPGVVLSRRVFAMRGVLLVMKTLEDERYVVIKAYKCTVSEIWRDFFCIGMYCVYVVSLHIDSTESMINKITINQNNYKCKQNIQTLHVIQVTRS